MKKRDEKALIEGLARVIGDWLDSDQRPHPEGFPWVGDNIAPIMAEAAIAVLRGMTDSQAYLRREKMLKED
jgi:hypothetical protein